MAKSLRKGIERTPNPFQRQKRQKEPRRARTKAFLREKRRKMTKSKRRRERRLKNQRREIFQNPKESPRKPENDVFSISLWNYYDENISAITFQ